MGKIPENITGNIYNKLTVLNYNTKGKWFCKCECGNETCVDQFKLKQGIIKSCGCHKNKLKGLSKHPQYNTYIHLIDRCYNNKSEKYKNYGARGITVCDRWLNSFENFLEDMGEKPTSLHSLDRINVDGNYEPSNCKWSTEKEQQNNRTNNQRITYKNETKNLIQWCEDLNLTYAKIYYRIFIAKWDINKALETI